MKGVVLIAAGSHYYGQMAFNLAMGLKYTDPSTSITLLWSGNGKNHLHEKHLSLFENIIEIPDEALKNAHGMPVLVKPKTYLYDLSPYQETIFIDADVMWFPHKPISMLFDELQDVDFTMGCRGTSVLANNPKLIWAKAEEYEKTGAEFIYNLSSEFIYFKKNKQNEDFFELAKTFYDHPQIEYKRFDGGLPDELAFQLSIIHSVTKPHKDLFLPFYWESYERKSLFVPEIYNGDWYGYSIGGNAMLPSTKALYDNLAIFYSQNFGVKYPFLAQNKKDVMKFRTNI